MQGPLWLLASVAVQKYTESEVRWICALAWYVFVVTTHLFPTWHVIWYAPIEQLQASFTVQVSFRHVSEAA